jgi:hypothetical protein
MKAPAWREPGDPALFRAIAGCWELAARAFPRRFPPGVYKHRSVEDAKALRQAWEDADFRRLWAGRAAPPD